GVAIGTMFFEFNTTGVARIAANAGADFALFDTEHTGWDADTIRTLMATARAAALVPMVRVPATQYHLIARPLDLGAMGIMIPMVESEEQARLFVRSAKYPPDGGRGAAFGVAHDDYEGAGLHGRRRGDGPTAPVPGVPLPRLLGRHLALRAGPPAGRDRPPGGSPRRGPRDARLRPPARRAAFARPGGSVQSTGRRPEDPEALE